MTNNKPLLSIAVPTKNRYDCLKVLIELFTKVHISQDIELVISDNSDDNTEFVEYLNSLSDKRIIYTYTKESISVCDNCDKAILASSGEYVNLIGDDDGNQREIIDVARYMKLHDIDSLNCYRCQYRWPGLKSMVLKSDGCLKTRRFKGTLVFVDPVKELRKVLKSGACSTYGKLPCVYNGIIKRKVLDKIFDKTGTFFPGPSPDMSNAVALSLVSKTHLWLDYPISWAGKSAKSAGGLGAQHKHSNRIDQVPWLPRDAAKKWDVRLPFYWTVTTVWAESAIKSLLRMNREDLINDLSFGNIYGNYIAATPNKWKDVKSLLNGNLIISAIYGFGISYFHRIRAFLNNILLKKFNKSMDFIRINGIYNVVDCEEYIHSNMPFQEKNMD